MLPGLRLLFAAIVLCISIVVFGLGAAALLKSAHEEFASKPSWRGGPEITFAQAPDSQPVLALLRMDPVREIRETPVRVEQGAEPANPVGEPADAPVTGIDVVETRQLAALTTAERAPTPPPLRPEALTPEKPAEQPAPTSDEPRHTGSIDHTVSESADSALGEGSVAVQRTRDESTPLPQADAHTAQSDPSRDQPQQAESRGAPPVPSPISQQDSDPIATKLASLGDAPQAPQVQIQEASESEATMHRRSAKRQAMARRAKERRRLAARRARLTRAAQVQTKDNFATPFAQPQPQLKQIQPAQDP